MRKTSGCLPFSPRLAAFALELRRKAGLLLPTDPDLDGQVIYDPPLPPLPTAAEIADKSKTPPIPPITEK